jgi:hypothetical protein
LSSRKAARFAVRFIALGVAAGTLAGYSAYAKRPANAGEPAEPQVSNITAKSDRLASAAQASLPAAADHAIYALASVQQRTDFDRLSSLVTSAIPAAPPAEAAAQPVEPEAAAAVAAIPLPQPRPKLLPPPPPAPYPANLLDDHQIAGLKGRLRLTSDQAEYWPAV